MTGEVVFVEDWMEERLPGERVVFLKINWYKLSDVYNTMLEARDITMILSIHIIGH